jgi:hypothetical protein
VRPRKDHRGVDLISDVLPFGRLWYQVLRQIVGYPYGFGDFHAGIDFFHKKSLKKNL